MATGELRKKILDECPDDFRTELYNWISEIEISLCDVLNNFDINCVEDLHKIEDAKTALVDIVDGLY